MTNIVINKPTFFIIGAPKCGTTSLALWLSMHPSVSLSNPKEPEFFNSDIRPVMRGGLEKYEAIFRRAGDHDLVLGEASTVYLRSTVAVKRILDYQPEARFIIGVRHPVSMLRSWHGQMLRNGWETERDLHAAWKLQRVRRHGRRVPRLCPDVKHLMYEDVCSIGSQVESVLNMVGDGRCFIYSLDELAAHPASVWDGVCDFLDIPLQPKQNFEVVNEAVAIPRWLATVALIVWHAKERVGLSHKGFGFLDVIKRHVARKSAREMNQEFVDELLSVFANELALLERLTHCKLELL